MERRLRRGWRRVWEPSDLHTQCAHRSGERSGHGGSVNPRSVWTPTQIRTTILNLSEAQPKRINFSICVSPQAFQSVGSSWTSHPRSLSKSTLSDGGASLDCDLFWGLSVFPISATPSSTTMVLNLDFVLRSGEGRAREGESFYVHLGIEVFHVGGEDGLQFNSLVHR